jgi:hypothetical protein
MLTFSSRALLASALVSFAFVSSNSAVAELPVVLPIQQFEPTGEESSDPIGVEALPTEFGRDVVIRDGFAFIGMPLTLTTGRVAVLTQGTSGWVRTATITASDMTSGDEFGRAVSYRDGLLVVGSVRAAYVFKRMNGAWRQRQKIVPAAADGVGLFATDLKHEAGVLAIGAFGNETTRDSVFVYEQDATGRFVRRARIMASDGRLRDQFGSSISMTNRIIVAGAPGANAAYILGPNSTGRWVQRQKLVQAAGPSGSFGSAVAVDRDMILVSAPDALVPGVDVERPLRGLVYGFLPGATQYLESFQLSQHGPDVEPDGLPDAWPFGRSIAMFDEHIVIGGDRIEDDGETPGVALVATYRREGSSVIRVGSLYPVDVGVVTVPTSMSIANNLLLVGSPYGNCPFVAGCTGNATLFHLNRLVPFPR